MNKDLAWVKARSLGRHLVELLDTGRQEETRAAFIAIEEAIVLGGPASINVVTTGLMEAVDPRRDDFEPSDQ